MACVGPSFQLELIKDPVTRESFQKIQQFFCDANGLIGLVSAQIAANSSPGFSYGAPGNSPAGTYFQNNGVPSNKSNIPVPVELGRIARIAFANEDVSTCDIRIQQHDGDSVNLVDIVTVSVVGVRIKVFDLIGAGVLVSPGKCVAAKVQTGSCKNATLGITMLGEL